VPEARAVVKTGLAPAAIGPYSQGIVAGGFVFTAGQIALDASSGEMLGAGDVAKETEQVLRNLSAILGAAGSSLEQVVRCDVYLADLADFQAMNAVYARSFPAAPPARVTVQAAALPRGARVEIAAIARIG
jgi:2-iminobutanoate/2-iminopropanoate deaminase